MRAALAARATNSSVAAVNLSRDGEHMRKIKFDGPRLSSSTYTFAPVLRRICSKVDAFLPRNRPLYLMSCRVSSVNTSGCRSGCRRGDLDLERWCWRLMGLRALVSLRVSLLVGLRALVSRFLDLDLDLERCWWWWWWCRQSSRIT